MYEAIKAIEGLEKQKQSYQRSIDQIKNIPDDMVYVSSVPGETAEDAIKDFEGSIRLIDLAIEKIRQL